MEVAERRAVVLARWAQLKSLLGTWRNKLGQSQSFQQFKREADEAEMWVGEKMQVACDDSYKDPTDLPVSSYGVVCCLCVVCGGKEGKREGGRERGKGGGGPREGESITPHQVRVLCHIIHTLCCYCTGETPEASSLQCGGGGQQREDILSHCHGTELVPIHIIIIIIILMRRPPPYTLYIYSTVLRDCA